MGAGRGSQEAVRRPSLGKLELGALFRLPVHKLCQQKLLQACMCLPLGRGPGREQAGSAAQGQPVHAAGAAVPCSTQRHGPVSVESQHCGVCSSLCDPSDGFILLSVNSLDASAVKHGWLLKKTKETKAEMAGSKDPALQMCSTPFRARGTRNQTELGLCGRGSGQQ